MISYGNEEALLPPAIQLRKEIDRLPGTLDALRSEREARDAVNELNLRIAEYLRVPVGPRVAVGPVDVEDALRRWREGRESPAPDVEPDRPQPAPRRVRWWERVLRRGPTADRARL